jgi:membrane protein YqaA with SNARE-associated domain
VRLPPLGHYLHALRDRLAALARHPLALPALFVVALVEASLVPIPPDLLLIPLSLARPRRTFFIATVCIAGSVAGAMIGYVIGATLFESVGEKLIVLLGIGGAFDHVLQLYRENALWTLLFAGFTSIPFSVFTIAAGFHHTIGPMTLLTGASMGRILRFYLLAGVLVAGGPAVRRLIEKHLPAVSLAIFLLAAACFVLIRFLR